MEPVASHSPPVRVWAATFAQTVPVNDWRAVLTQWLAGQPLSAMNEKQMDVAQFIESDIIYRLVWGIEAARVYELAQGNLAADLVDGSATAALEAGTLSRAAALLLRLLRLLKLFRYSDSLMVFARVFREKAGQLTASFFVTGILLVLASGVVYYCERGAQPEAFGSIPTTMWWGIVTLTTVGYGDVSPVTPVGQLFGAITAIIGIGLVALPSGILAGGFIEAFAEGDSQEDSSVQDATDRCPHCGEPL